MAFESKVTPGKKFGNGFKAKRYDEMKGKGGAMESPMHEAKETPEFEAGEKEGAQEQNKEGGEQPSEVVSQHGKAKTVHIAHDHKANKHKLVSTHEDGHVHESEHNSPQEAHDAGKQLAGTGEGSEQEEENPMMGAESQDDGFSMPAL